MNIFEPPDMNGESEVKAYANGVWGFLGEIDAMQLSGPILYHKRALEQALTGVARGNRAVGAVIVHKGENMVAEACNTVNDPDNPLRHVAHAEINAITSLNERYAGEVQRMLADLELYSTLGPCGMCLRSTINEKIPRISSLSPDYSGQETLDDVLRSQPGWASHIQEIGMSLKVADLSEYPNDLGKKLHFLAWTLSRISKFRFDRESFQLGAHSLNGALIAKEGSGDA